MSLLATGQSNVSIFFKNIDTFSPHVDGDDILKKRVDEIGFYRRVVRLHGDALLKQFQSQKESFKRNPGFIEFW